VVVSIDSLACLDYLIWLRSGSAAAARLGLTQPTVSRNVSRVSEIFAIELVKPNGEWELNGDTTLLNLERSVHQRYRWFRQLPLRIEAQYYSGPLFCDGLLSGWHVGNFDFLEVHTPLKHLREGVIDAWIGCYPDVPDDDDNDLTCFHLTRLPVRLVVAQDHPLLELGEAITLEDVKRYPSLALPDHAFPRVQEILQGLGLWNLPLNLQRYRDNWQNKIQSGLTVGYATSFTLHLFRSPQVVLPLQIPLEVGDTLIVRRDYADHPRLIGLRDNLKAKSLELAKRFGDVRVF
jgi:DNA-binding transcriptional LysR family regulator